MEPSIGDFWLNGWVSLPMKVLQSQKMNGSGLILEEVSKIFALDVGIISRGGRMMQKRLPSSSVFMLFVLVCSVLILKCIISIK